MVGVHWVRPERANCSRAPEPPRRAPGLVPHCKAVPHTPLLTTNLQAALAPYNAAVRALLAARRRLQCASAMDGAARAASARHLPPGAARAHPQACSVVLVAATFL